MSYSRQKFRLDAAALRREWLASIVFHGPRLGGKAACLRCVHANADSEGRGEVRSPLTESSGVLSFDLLPRGLESLRGHRLCAELQAARSDTPRATREALLGRADGVIFVADSQAAMDEQNELAMDELSSALAGRDRPALVLLYNKRDLPGQRPLDELNAQLNPDGLPWFEGVASQGRGVFEALDACVRQVHRRRAGGRTA